MKKTLLIVVCSVFALCVIAFLVNIFQRVPEKANGITCKSNVRQLVIIAKPGIIPALPTILGFTANIFPIVDGSTSTEPLTDLLIAKMLGLRANMNHGDVNLSARSSNKSTDCYNALWAQSYHYGTHEAYVNLLSPSAHAASSTTNIAPCELILVARKLSADERQLAKTRGIGLDVRPVALDAFVFLINKRNPVHSLTLDQIRAIYTGQTTNWQSLGGHNKSFVAYMRNANSGSEELMHELVMSNAKTISLKAEWRELDSMEAPVNAIAEDPNAIAYSVYYYEHFINHRKENRLLAINSIQPTSDNIATRKYPLTAEVYVVTRKNLPPDSPTAKVRDWLLSAEGQQMVKRSGYVPVGAGQ